jgi:bifunctional non-homologous end joining protein LigD
MLSHGLPLGLHDPTGFVAPCLPVRSRIVPNGPQWVYEIKHDGYRFICRREGERVRVFSRHRLEWTDRVPQITQALWSLPVTSVTLDGEGVVCDERGVSDFGRLRSALGHTSSRTVFLYAFDLLELDGQDVRSLPWESRRESLTRLLRTANPGIRLSEHLEGAPGETIFQHVCAFGLEGVVAKRRDRPYWSGRCADWVKVKNPDAPATVRLIER